MIGTSSYYWSKCSDPYPTTKRRWVIIDVMNVVYNHWKMRLGEVEGLDVRGAQHCIMSAKGASSTRDRGGKSR